MKKIISLLIICFMLFTAIPASFAQYSDVPEAAAYKSALDRVSALGIFSGTGDGSFNPEGLLTREQFAKIIITAANLADTLNSSQNTAVFPDVTADLWSSTYINAAVKKGYLVGMPDRLFHPEDNITFAQACTVFVRMLGYADADLTGMWPQNYIDKAKSLYITRGLNFADDAGVPRWAAAVIVDNLLQTETKKASPTDTVRKFAESSGLFSECIILADSRSSSKLASKEVQTDKGILINQSGEALEVGTKYMLKLDQDTIVKVYGNFSSIKKISVSYYDGTTAYYKPVSQDGSNASGQNDEVVPEILPAKAVYYYNGAKQNFDSLKNILKSGQSIFLGTNRDNSGYDYVVIKDPYSDSYGAYTECIVLDNSLTSQKLLTNQVITDQGILQVSDSVEKLELGVKYAVYVKDGIITAVSAKLSSTSLATVQNAGDSSLTIIEGKDSKNITLQQKAVYYYKGAKQNYDSLKGILKPGQIIFFGSSREDSGYDYAVIKDPFSDSYGTYMECIILEDSSMSRKLEANQVTTDQGIFEVYASVGKLEPGTKYAVYVKDGVITVKCDKLNTTVTAAVYNTQEPSVIIKEGTGTKNLVLPQKAVYYYKGVKQNYDALKNVLKTNQSIYLGYDQDQKSLEYAVIRDPFDDSYGTYYECVILDDSTASSKLENGQISTDQGIFLLPESAGRVEIGAKYGLYVKDGVVTAIYKKLNSFKTAAVSNASSASVKINGEPGNTSIILPQKAAYYYKGTKLNYDALKNTLKPDQIIYLGLNQDKTNYEYVIVKDPFDDSFGTYTECIILDDSSTSGKLEYNQVLTDKGIYQLSGAVPKLELGLKYGLYVKDDRIVGIYNVLNARVNASVLYSVDTRVSLKMGDTTNTITLPQKAAYYYNGAKQSYDNLKNILQRNTSVIFAFNSDGSAYEYAVIYDPVFSQPQVEGYHPEDSSNSSSIDLSGSPLIVKNGDLIDESSIVYNDVLYEVTDIWKDNRYIMVVSNRINGIIMGYQPSRLSPKSIQIQYFNTDTNKMETKTYEFNRDFDVSQLTSGSFKVGQVVYLLLGYDGKVVKIVTF